MAEKEPKWVKAIKKDPSLLNVMDIMRGDKKELKGLVRSFRGGLQKNWWNLDSNKLKRAGLAPPIQPLMVLFEGENISYEGFAYDWINVFNGTGGFKLDAIKLFEKFYYTEASQAHGTMLQKISYQRNQAKEFLASIQNLKTAIINIESDLEKLDEQLKAFKKGDWEQIKGLFIDNYGGPQRSWTAVARNVPLVRMAMTWFLRLGIKHKEALPIEEFSKLKINEFTKDNAKDVSNKISELKGELEDGAGVNKKAMLKEIEGLVKAETMNPAIANYLKRKIEEFWNWVISYVGWISKTRNGIQTNLIQQKANMKLYMQWAADSINQAKSMEMNPEAIVEDLVEFNFKGSPREMIRMDYLFFPGDDRPDIVELCEPWVPIIATLVVVGTTVELQKKFTEMGFVNMYGYIKKVDAEKLKDLVKNEKKNLVKTMLDAGAVTADELPKLFTKEELEEMEGKIKEGKTTFKDDLNFFWGGVVDNLKGLGSLFGIDLPEESFPWARRMRAATIAADLTLRGINDFKKGKGMLTTE